MIINCVYFRDGENTLAVAPGYEKGLAETVCGFIDDVPLRLRLIENGMEPVWHWHYTGIRLVLNYPI